MSSKGTITQPPPRQFKGTTPPPNPPPDPTPTPQPGTLLYDSNVDIDWALWDGKKIEIGKPYGDPNKPNSKYIRMNASGSPNITFLAATKELLLQHGGSFGRGYLGVCNYNVRVECEFKLDSCSNNFSIKARNRHQYRQYLMEALGYTKEQADKVIIELCQGGMGYAIHCDSVENDLEIEHGSGEVGGPSKSIPKLDISKYHQTKFSVFDKSGKIHIIDELDGKIVSEGDLSPPSQFFKTSDFAAFSEIWFRLNAGSGGKIYIKNIKVYSI